MAEKDRLKITGRSSKVSPEIPSLRRYTSSQIEKSSCQFLPSMVSPHLSQLTVGGAQKLRNYS